MGELIYTSILSGIFNALLQECNINQATPAIKEIKNAYIFSLLSTFTPIANADTAIKNTASSKIIFFIRIIKKLNSHYFII
jgi:hypothetical protein